MFYKKVLVSQGSQEFDVVVCFVYVVQQYFYCVGGVYVVDDFMQQLYFFEDFGLKQQFFVVGV